MAVPRVRGSRPLVLTDPTLLVRRANERLVILRERKEVAAFPLVELSHVAVHGPVTLTGAALAGLLDAGIDVTLFSSSGFYRGTISSAQSGNVFLLLAQVDAWKREDRRVAFARASLASKIAGQRAVVHRHARDHDAPRCRAATNRLMSLESAIEGEDTVDAVMGVEGAAAAEYFEAFGEMLAAPWPWRGRVRRPATDPVNALLSYGYALATGEVARLLAWGGFDGRVGLVHGLRYGRQSLALDLVEEFRPVLVDRFVLRVVNRRQFALDDFEEHDGGAVRLSSEARRRFLELWEELLASRAPALRNDVDLPSDFERPEAVRIGGTGSGADPAGDGEGPTWRGRMERQVGRLRRFVMRGEAYRGLMASKNAGNAEEIDSQRAEEDDETPENA